MKRMRLRLSIYILTFQLTGPCLAPGIALAADQCAHVFQAPLSTPNELSKQQLTRLRTALQSLDAVLSVFNEMSVEQEMIQHALNEAALSTEFYLNSIGVTFERSPRQLKDVYYAGAHIPLLNYHVYKLSSAQGAKNIHARAIRGVLDNSRTNVSAIILDPLHAFHKPEILAYYSAEASSIHISPDHFILAEEGTLDLLRHEAQHAIEEQKWRDGKPTLAIFHFFSTIKDRSSYGRAMAGDEIEAQLREFRYLKNIGPRTDAGLSAEQQSANALERKTLRGKSAVRIRGMIQDARAALIELQSNPEFSPNTTATNGTQVYSDLKNSAYSHVHFRAKPGSPNTPSQLIQAAITWSLQRLKAVEAELSREGF